MKSLLPNNFINPGANDRASSTGGDLGIFDRGLGKKDPSAKADTGFASFLMDAVHNERQMAEPKGPALPQQNTPSIDDRQAAQKLERDLLERRTAAPAERASAREVEAPSKDAKPKLAARGDDDVSPKDERPVKAAPSKEKSQPITAPVSRELRPLKMAVGNKNSAESMAGNNAVLAFVTGQLDRLDPEGIPGIITGNAFLKQAVASDEIADLMTQPMAIADLYKLFEIDQSVINKAATNGLDTNLMVTPKDFLAAIGVDPGKVSTELQLLQQRLPVEGVKSYVDRAKALSQLKANPLGGLVDELGQPTSAVTIGRQGTPSDAEDDSSIPVITGAPTIVPATSMPGAMPGIQVPPSSAVANSKPNLGNPTSPAKTSLRVDQPSRASSSDLIESILANRELGSSPMSWTAQQNTSVLDPVSLRDTVVDSAEDTLVDPFAALGLEMSAHQSERLVFEPTNVGRSMANLEEQLQANGFALPSKQLTVAQDPTKLIPKDQFMPTDLRQVATDDVANDSLSNLSFDAFSSLNHNSQNTVNLNLLTGVAHGISGTGEGTSGFQDSFFGQSEKGEGDQFAGSTLPGTQPLNQTSQVKEGAFATILDQAPTEAPKASLPNKILQHATMMLKDGGGTMRMDFEAPGMGKIDLAINLADNNLDVRILTPNDSVRDIINKELSGLRDGLGQQGISLRTVEVGNASQSSNQFAGGRFGQGNQGQQASYNEMKEYAKSFAGSFNSAKETVQRLDVGDTRRSIPSAWMNSVRDNSRISVRI